jgi:hypothetical protein
MSTGSDDTRRSFVRKAGIAVGVSWTAPVILSSPAVAQSTGAANQFRAEWDGSATRVTPENGGGCNPPVWNNLPEFPDQIGVDITLASVAFTVSSGSCTFVGGRANGSGGGECEDGVLSNGDQTITFPTDFVFTEFRVVLNC